MLATLLSTNFLITPKLNNVYTKAFPLYFLDPFVQSNAFQVIRCRPFQSTAKEIFSSILEPTNRYLNRFLFGIHWESNVGICRHHLWHWDITVCRERRSNWIKIMHSRWLSFDRLKWKWFVAFFCLVLFTLCELIFNANSDRHELSQLKKPGRKRITVSFSSSFIVWPLDLC